ncbi:DUF397 domain-containing protein [Streptomyces griseoloalbus]|uniref:DUF397 domain-containing protein n=1 Tax=Streptomyces griseoloalbus TaxID=67303 RepID=A0ABV3DX65_9ACTN
MGFVHVARRPGPACRGARVAATPGTVQVWDSKVPGGPRLTRTAGAWARFVAPAGDGGRP